MLIATGRRLADRVLGWNAADRAEPQSRDPGLVSIQRTGPSLRPAALTEPTWMLLCTYFMLKVIQVPSPAAPAAEIRAGAER